MSALEHEWPDEDRRHEALINALCDVYRAEEPEQHDDLTSAETRVIEALSRGMGDGGAAEILGMSTFTAKHHSKTARRKLRAKNTAHACCEALRRGLIR